MAWLTFDQFAPDQARQPIQSENHQHDQDEIIANILPILLGLDGLGEKLIDQLVDAGVIRTLPDLYKLGLTALVQLDRMAEKSALNILPDE